MTKIEAVDLNSISGLMKAENARTKVRVREERKTKR